MVDVKYNRKQIYDAINKNFKKGFYKKIKISQKSLWKWFNSSQKIINIIKIVNLKNFNTQKKITY